MRRLSPAFPMLIAAALATSSSIMARNYDDGLLWLAAGFPFIPVAFAVSPIPRHGPQSPQLKRVCTV